MKIRSETGISFSDIPRLTHKTSCFKVKVQLVDLNVICFFVFADDQSYIKYTIVGTWICQSSDKCISIQQVCHYLQTYLTCSLKSLLIFIIKNIEYHICVETL